MHSSFPSTPKRIHLHWTEGFSGRIGGSGAQESGRPENSDTAAWDHRRGEPRQTRVRSGWGLAERRQTRPLAVSGVSARVPRSPPCQFANRTTRPPIPDGCVHHLETENQEGESFAVREAETAVRPRSPFSPVPNQRVGPPTCPSQLSAPTADRTTPQQISPPGPAFTSRATAVRGPKTWLAVPNANLHPSG